MVAKSTTANSGANRIRIGGPADGLVYSFTVNGIRFDGSADKDAGTIKTAYGGTGNTSFTANRLIFSETATKLSSASNIYVTHSGIAINADHITEGYVFEVSGDSRFFGATTTTGVATFNGNVVMNSSVTTDSLTAGSLIVSGNSSFVNVANTNTLLPHANNTYDIGSSSLKYKNIYGALKGNADTATEFATATTVALTGVVTGTSASSKRGWSITTTIGDAKITNAMLAGSITNNKLSTPYIQIIGQRVDLGDNIELATLLSLLGLSTSMRYIGKATLAITDGGTENPTIDGYTWPDDRRTGDVVIDSDENAEYVWALSGKWEKLGPESSYKVRQTPLG